MDTSLNTSNFHGKTAGNIMNRSSYRNVRDKNMTFIPMEQKTDDTYYKYKQEKMAKLSEARKLAVLGTKED